MNTAKMNPIAYRWALDAVGTPLPINMAQRGQPYFCPLCRGAMIARLGSTLQHHFGHEMESGCTPEAVTRAALARWITIHLRDAVTAKQPVKVIWKCQHCGDSHTADILQGVSAVLEGYLRESYFADVAILHEKSTPACSVIMVQDELAPTPETQNYFTSISKFSITVPAAVLPTGSDLTSLMTHARLLGGPCPVLQSLPNVIRDAEGIQKALKNSVSRWPAYFYGALETVRGAKHLLKVGDSYLWLPPEHWQQIIGGMRNPLGSGVNVTIQTWMHTDGGQIWLYYVTVRDTFAVGVRRYAPGEAPAPRLDGRFRHSKVTAFDVAQNLVKGSLENTPA